MACLTTDLKRIIWQCHATGKPKKITIPAGARTKTKAAEWLKYAEALIAARHHNEESPRETREWIQKLNPQSRTKFEAVGLIDGGNTAPTTMDAFLTFAVAQKSDGKAKATMAHYRQSKNCAVAFFGKARSITSLTSGDAMAFYNAIRKTKDSRKTKNSKKAATYLSDNTARTRCKDMRALLQVAVNFELIAKNPFAHREVPKAVRPAGREANHYLTMEHTRAILDTCLQMGDRELRAMVALCRIGGLRPGEALLMQWDHIQWGTKPDGSDGRLTVLSPKTKHHEGKDRRLVPLFAELRPILLDLFTHAAEGVPRLLPAFKTTQGAANRLVVAMQRAEVPAYPRLWQNQRASASNDVLRKYGRHCESEWIGHDPDTADEFYIHASEDEFALAARDLVTKQPSETDGKKEARNEAMQDPKREPNSPKAILAPTPHANEKTLVSKGLSLSLGLLEGESKNLAMAPVGV